MTRKHYRLLARALREVRERHERYDGCPIAAIAEIEDKLIALLQADNPRFDEAMFRDAAQV